MMYLLQQLTDIFCVSFAQALRLRLKIMFVHPSAGPVTQQVNWTEPS